MRYEFDLVWGLTVPGTDKVVKRVAIKPLTIGAELRAAAEIDDLQLGEAETAADKTGAMMAETLAYWAQQLTVEGIPQEQLTGAYLMDNLTGEDYSVILKAQEDMRVKYTAAGADRGSTAAEDPQTGDTPPNTEITGKPLS